ncbi:MAG: type I DNA topoisomerase [Oscillatoriales cyanobacterium]|nr:MAG: type I DNA topoisomerase [Oscillatoriales cyanobacterium]
MSTLVIVESPTKARTIQKYLPKGYRVEASMGHVRDLPQSASEIPAAYKKEKWSQLGVNVEADFEPIYVVPRDKKKVVKALKDALKQADELVLATDEDREGESISWHLLEVLKPKVPTKRMVFHEITEEAILHAIANCRDIDVQLVHAQETRRILDRLVGYTLSPLLWKKIAPKLSAGRVQSVSVRLLVMRERERRAFVKGAYWDLKAQLTKDSIPFSAKLVSVDGTKVATGSDFDEATGKIKAGKKVKLLDRAEAEALLATIDGQPWRVTKLDAKSSKRKPAPPFTTSTLQQEANRKLHLSARDTMRVAQSLYENGYITYMRTDSVHLSTQAIEAARNCVELKYGKEYLSPKPRQYATKNKSAQEAHEAIRPAGSTFRTPKETGLKDRDLALYDLIWKRTVACQMAEALQTFITVDLQVANAGFRTSGKRIDFPGFFRAYVEGSDDPNAALDDREVILPTLAVDDQPDCQAVEPVGHETQPPARYSEASLVKTLESEGIGRPSTYASIIGTIIDRGYAQLQGNALIPTFTAFAVSALLEKHFPDLVDTRFTARMEETLDRVSTGDVDHLPYLKTFYSGDRGLDTQVKAQEEHIDPSQAKTVQLENLSVKVRIGKFGPYLETEYEGEPVTASIPHNLTPADLSAAQVKVLIEQKTKGPESIGTHPETGEPIYVLIGSYGPYVQLGDVTEDNPKPKRTSLPKGVTPETLTLEMAIGLLALPRLLGTHPETGNKIQTNLGRFGPYVVHKKGGEEGKDDYRSLKVAMGDDVLTIDLPRALEILAEPKRTRRRAAKKPLRELGNSGDEPIAIFDGPYGPYIKYKRKNVSLPEGADVEQFTLEQAIELVGAKKTPSKTTSKTTAKKSTAKTTTTKKATTKKATTTKTTAKKTTLT